MNWQAAYRWYWVAAGVFLGWLLNEMSRHPWLVHLVLWPW